MEILLIIATEGGIDPQKQSLENGRGFLRRDLRDRSNLNPLLRRRKGLFAPLFLFFLLEKEEGDTFQEHSLDTMEKDMGNIAIVCRSRKECS